MSNLCKLSEWLAIENNRAKILLDIPNLREYYSLLTYPVAKTPTRELGILEKIAQGMLYKRAPLLFPFIYVRFVCANTGYAILQPGGPRLGDLFQGKDFTWWAELLYQVSRAVLYLEDQKINHNNLNPDTIQLQDPNLAVMLVDFSSATTDKFVLGKDLNYLFYILVYGGYLPQKWAQNLQQFIKLRDLPVKANEDPFTHGLRRAKIEHANWRTSGKYISRWIVKMYPQVAISCNAERMNKLFGVGIGATIGDAYGMPLEFDYSTPGALKSMRGSGEFKGLLSFYDLPPGTFTDDTQMALAIVDAILLQGRTVNQTEIARQFKRWAKSDPIDIGTQTRSVLEAIVKDGSNWQQASQAAFEKKPQSAANGATMRAWPIAVLHHNGSMDLVIADTIRQAQVTHMNKDAVYAAVFVTCLIYELVNGGELNKSIDQALAIVTDHISLELYNALTIDPNKFPYKDLVGGSGWIVNTMSVVMWSIKKSRNFAQAILYAANVRGDTDTNACIAGAIAGAMYGLSAIPKQWLQVLDAGSEWNFWYGHKINVETLKDIIASVAGC